MPKLRSASAFLRSLPSLLTLAPLPAFAVSGCSDSTLCQRRPWECHAIEGEGGKASTSTGGNTGTSAAPSSSCDSYVPPEYKELTENPKLPDPFMSASGTRIASSADWECRRAEIKAQAQKYEFGTKPPPPESVHATFEGSSVNVSITNGSSTGSFAATVTYPSSGAGPYPAMIGVGGISIGSSELNDLGVATIVFPNDVVAQQVDGSSRGKGIFFDLNPTFKDTGALMAWAWGVGRLIDALDTLPDARIDTSRLGVTGCSRNGKGALVVGAFEERIVLTIPQESGSGGAASWRVSDAMFASGTEVQTLHQITGENVWFRSNFSQFNYAANRLPYDHHMIEGLVAPRALLVIENTSQVWLGNLSTFTNSMVAHRVWDALGIPDKMGFSQVGDHAHCVWNGSQRSELQAYVKKFLVGESDETIDTNMLKSDDPTLAVDEDTWIDWTVPAL